MLPPLGVMQINPQCVELDISSHRKWFDCHFKIAKKTYVSILFDNWHNGCYLFTELDRGYDALFTQISISTFGLKAYGTNLA